MRRFCVANERTNWVIRKVVIELDSKLKQGEIVLK